MSRMESFVQQMAFVRTSSRLSAGVAGSVSVLANDLRRPQCCFRTIGELLQQCRDQTRDQLEAGYPARSGLEFPFAVAAAVETGETRNPFRTEKRLLIGSRAVIVVAAAL